GVGRGPRARHGGASPWGEGVGFGVRVGAGVGAFPVPGEPPVDGWPGPVVVRGPELRSAPGRWDPLPFPPHAGRGLVGESRSAPRGDTRWNGPRGAQTKGNGTSEHVDRGGA